MKKVKQSTPKCLLTNKLVYKHNSYFFFDMENKTFLTLGTYSQSTLSGIKYKYKLI